MDKLNRYRKLIQQILSERIAFDNQQATEGVEHFLIADEKNDHYVWFNLGWHERKRIKSITVYVRICNKKFWIEEDLTEEGIANVLVEEGVPKEDIVLAFHAPEMRPYTDFAAA